MTTHYTTPGTEDGFTAAIRLLAAAVGVGVTAGIIFTLFPALDMAVIAIFFDPPSGLFLGESSFVPAVRDGFQILFAGSCIIAVGGLLLGLFRKVSLFGQSAIHWFYFLVCAAVGPGLIANLIFKDQWGRARPYQISEFGGDMTYSTPLIPSTQCDYNCSFVSGEAATIYLLFFALALMFPRYRIALLVVGILAGTLSGIVRMSQGGHFPSDVVFAGVFMAAVSALLYLGFFSIPKRA